MIKKTTLLMMYEMMVLIRRFEEEVGDLVAKGEIKTPCHLYIGQEAVATGACFALEKTDLIFGNHRSHGHYLAKGGSTKELMAEIFGKKTGCSRGKGGSMHIVAPEVGLLGTVPIVGASIPIAAGAALALNLKKEKRVSVSFFGDGAVNEGVFYETLNFSSLEKLPIIFVCENNFYSSHMPISKTLANTNIAKKAEIFNLPGFQIDGNNVIEVFETTKKASERAKNSQGPTLIECQTYRWRGHVGPFDDLDKGLRSRGELDSWMQKCPIKRLEAILEISAAEKEKISQKIEREVKESVIFAKNSPYPDKKELYDKVLK